MKVRALALDCKEYLERTLNLGRWSVLNDHMRMVPDRAILTVTQHNGLWLVEHEGEPFGHSSDKEVAKAAANRHARTLLDSGRTCQVRVFGELGFWMAS